jgi:hypothetical protein
VVPPFTIHQHGGDEEAGCEIFVPQSRMFSILGLTKREPNQVRRETDFSAGKSRFKMSKASSSAIG